MLAVGGIYVLAALVGVVLMALFGTGVNWPVAAITAAAALVLAVAAFTRPQLLRRFDASYPSLLIAFGAVMASGAQHSPLLVDMLLVVIGSALFNPIRRLLPIVLIASVLTFLPIVIAGPADPTFVAEAGFLVVVMAALGYVVSDLARGAREQARMRAVLEEIFPASSFRGGQDLSRMLQQVVAVLRRLTSSDYAICYLLAEDGRTLTPEAGDIIPGYASDEAEILASWPVPVGSGLTGRVGQTGEALISGNMEQDPRAQHIPGSEQTSTSAVIVPLKVDDRVIGVLRLSSRGLNRYRQQDLHLAQVFAHYATFSIENARLFAETGRLYQKMRLLSTTDGLTGLYNQRYLTENGPRLLEQARERGVELSVLMIDSDCLKSVNDEFGHASGDHFLRELADVMRREVRASDTVVRYAGDEFIILLPNAGPVEASQIAERIRSAAEHIELGMTVPLAVSIGIATFPTHADDSEGLLQAADKALYLSKGAGRNRWTVYNRTAEMS